jgi:hypothetical protein
MTSGLFARWLANTGSFEKYRAGMTRPDTEVPMGTMLTFVEEATSGCR